MCHTLVCLRCFYEGVWKTKSAKSRGHTCWSAKSAGQMLKTKSAKSRGLTLRSKAIFYEKWNKRITNPKSSFQSWFASILGYLLINSMKPASKTWHLITSEIHRFESSKWLFWERLFDTNHDWNPSIFGSIRSQNLTVFESWLRTPITTEINRFWSSKLSFLKRILILSRLKSDDFDFWQKSQRKPILDPNHHWNPSISVSLRRKECCYKCWKYGTHKVQILEGSSEFSCKFDQSQ